MMNQPENEQKFLEFYGQHITKIYRYVYFRVGSEEIAQDLSSEAFLRAWQYLMQEKVIGNLSAMVYQICRNLIADYFRKNGKLPISLESVAELNLVEPESEMVKRTETGLELDKIRTGLKALKDEYQDLVVWHYIEGLSVPEICQICGKSDGAVRTSLSRALKALREVLEA